MDLNDLGFASSGIVSGGEPAMVGERCCHFIPRSATDRIMSKVQPGAADFEPVRVVVARAQALNWISDYARMAAWASQEISLCIGEMK